MDIVLPKQVEKGEEVLMLRTAHDLLCLLAVFREEGRVERRSAAIDGREDGPAHRDAGAQARVLVQRDAVDVAPGPQEDGHGGRPPGVDLLHRLLGRHHGAVDLPAVVVHGRRGRVVRPEEIPARDAVDAVRAQEAVGRGFGAVLEREADPVLAGPPLLDADEPPAEADAPRRDERQEPVQQVGPADRLPPLRPAELRHLLAPEPAVGQDDLGRHLPLLVAERQRLVGVRLAHLRADQRHGLDPVEVQRQARAHVSVRRDRLVDVDVEVRLLRQTCREGEPGDTAARNCDFDALFAHLR